MAALLVDKLKIKLLKTQIISQDLRSRVMNNSILLIELFLNCKHYCDLHALLVVEVSCRYRVVLRGHSGVVSLSCRRNQNFFASTLWPLSTTLRRQRHDTMIPLWPPSTITTRQRQLDDNSTTPLWP